jgi:tetratricopeptide (TPR) repeat protein
MIVEIAERDRALFRKLEVASAADGADDKTLAARLNKAIDQATATRGYVEYGDAGGWAGGVDEALDALDALDSRHDPLLFKLAERAIDRIESAIESIDDSNGECSVLLKRARDMHIRAARGVRPDPVALARDLYERETGDGDGTFDDAAWLYADVLGEAGLAEYRRLATEAWEKLPTLTGRGRQKPQGDYHGLQGILDSFAERDGDLETRIALRAKDLSSPWKYLELAEFCLKHKGANEALRWAEEGLWTFEDGPSDARLVLFAANLFMKAERHGEAEAVLKRAFERAPDFNVYLRWREAGGEAARDQALALVERLAATETGLSFGHPADLGVKILMREERFDMAWALTRKHRVSRTVKEELARESEGDHPREALEVYVRCVDDLANAGGNRAYEEAARFIARMGRLRDAAEQTAYVATLKERFSRRRNFVKLLA